MKKILSTITMVLAGIMLVAAPVSAATSVALSTPNTSVQAGKTFTVAISVNPQGTNNYVETVELKYPADLVAVNSFALAGTWIGLVQPGYDAMDNTNGILIKSAGYPGGFNTAMPFGTVSFTAKKAGAGTITVGSNSIAFEVNGQGAITGSPLAVVITAAPVVLAKPATAPKVAVPVSGSGAKATTSVAQTLVAQTTSEAATTVEAQEVPEQAQASLFGILDTKSGMFWMVLIIVLAIVGGGGYWVMQRRKNGMMQK